MIFKPYEKNPHHFFSLITFGLWQQGLVPRNKNQIAVELGREIENKLLNPEKMAGELCETAAAVFQDQNILNKIADETRQICRENETAILDFLYPQIETALADFLDRLLTEQNADLFFNEKIEPWLRKEETRQFIAEMTVRFAQKRSAQIIDLLKSQLHDFVYNFLSKNVLTKMMAKSLADGLVKSIPWTELEWKIYDKLREEKTVELVREELLHVVSQIKDQLASPQGRNKLNSFLQELKIDLKGNLAVWLQDSLPKMIRRAIESPGLKNWIEEKLIPASRPKLESWLKANGKEFIINRLNIAGRVQEAVDKQDVREFHQMINRLAANHLSAIQVLGYLLGAIIGAVQAVQLLFSNDSITDLPF